MEDKDASSHLRPFVYDLNNRKINRGALFPNRVDPDSRPTTAFRLGKDYA